MKNILIIGIGRSGKTTLSKMIKNKINTYNLIHSDCLKWSIIRAKNKELYYRENISEQKNFEHSEYFQSILLEFFKSLIDNDKCQYGYILESGQLHPKIVKEMIDFNNTIVVCLGLGNCSSEDIIKLCLKYDQEDDWTYGLKMEHLINHSKNWHNENEILKKECQKYGIKYYDTSQNRTKVLNEIMNKILEEK